jgi:hypothetical protein
MTPAHAEWRRFCDLLSWYAFDCSGDLEGATDVLHQHFPKVEVNASLDYFRTHGGVCDCGVLQHLVSNLAVLRAMYRCIAEWGIPYVSVDASCEDVEVPRAFVKGGVIVFNLNEEVATPALQE